MSRFDKLVSIVYVVVAVAILAAIHAAGARPAHAAGQIKTRILQPSEVGTIYGKDASYAIARATSKGCDGGLTVGQSADEYNSAVYRDYLRFDLTGFPEGATIDAAQLRVVTTLDQSLTADFDVLVYAVPWTSALCTFREANYDAPGLYGVLEGTLCNTVSGTGSYVLAVDESGMVPGGVVTYALRSSRDGLAQAPTGNEWIGQGFPVLTVLYH